MSVSIEGLASQSQTFDAIYIFWAKPCRQTLCKKINIALYCVLNNMSQNQLIQLRHKATGEVYWTRKNKKKVERKVELKKYSAKLRKHVVFKEAKK